MSPSPESQSRKDARQLVEGIAKKHGYLGEDVLSRMSDDVRRKVVDAMDRKDNMMGYSFKTLSKNLYNSSARFVFELLQNADDNKYSIAEELSDDPFVSFRMYPGRIAIDCNEDGFTRENLEAICSVGQSSKMGGQGYIGEKGIGFKSVFMVAWKAHIQSGDFSFSFQHKDGNSGMGMISPVWEDGFEALPEPLTRITLFLHEDLPDDVLRKQRETTLQQFRELQETVLLFLKRIRVIKVLMHGDDGEQVSSTTYYAKQSQLPNQVELRKEVVQGEEPCSTKYYHVTRSTVHGLPKSENQTYTEPGSSARTYEGAEVVLAFPLTHDSIPIVEAQDVFAFLPIRKMGFPFLIQSDFVTDVSRQDIVRSSDRNIGLLDGILRAFIQAVKQFCKHPTLRYQWMRYLPPEEYPWDDFWAKLLRLIRTELESTRLLWTRSHRMQCHIKNMRRLHQYMLDNKGDPLFPNSNPKQYLASQYSEEDLDRLEKYGLRRMSMRGFLDRASLDLENRSSVMRSPKTAEDWRTRVAEALLSACDDSWAWRVAILPMIPLIGNQWAAASSSNIYYCHVDGHAVPTDLGLNLVDPHAESNSQRKRLFDCLGVQEPISRSVRHMIKQKHESDIVPDLVTSRNHLRFLYLTAQLDVDDDRPSSYKDVTLLDDTGRALRPHYHEFYFSDDDPYSAKQLLRPAISAQESAETDSVVGISFVPHKYMDNCPEQPRGECRTWRTWLTTALAIQDTIPVARSGRLSKECVYVAKHRPEKLLGFLLRHCKVDGDNSTESRGLTDQLPKLQVLCKNDRMHPLSESYFRTDKNDHVDRFLQDGEFFPWLYIDDSLRNPAQLFELVALGSALGFGHPKSDLELYLTVLRFIVGANRVPREMKSVSRVFELYGRIVTRYEESDSQGSCRQMIKDAFKLQELIYIPENGSQTARWASPEACLLDAPADMESKFALGPRYKGIMHTKHTTALFKDILQIRNANIGDFLGELCWLNANERTNFGHVHKVYKEIGRLRKDMDSTMVRRVRELFEARALICVRVDNAACWYKVSKCLWSTAADIKGMVAVNNDYADLRDFFIEFLGVQTLTAKMMVDKLQEQGQEASSVSEVKETIWGLNTLLHAENEPPNPDGVRSSKVLPVKYPNGGVELCTSETAVAIADRKHLFKLFSGNCKLLDFEVNDIPRLEPFLMWARLEDRYLSSSVQETSTLCGGPDRPLSSSDRNIARKAHGLLRIAVHFRSPRVRDGERRFYEVLKNIEVRETDGIRSELHLSQDGNDIRVEVNRSELHLVGHDAGLMLYIPRNEQAQDLCFLDRIPYALLKWIMTEPSTGACESFNDKAVSAMHTLLQPHNKYVSLVLDRAGILSVETPDDSMDLPTDAADPTARRPSEQAVSQITRSESGGNENGFDRDAPESSLHGDPGEISGMISTLAISAGSSRTADTAPSPQGETQGRYPSASSGFGPSLQPEYPEYRRVLRSVVTSARNTSLPNKGSVGFGMPGLGHTLGLPTSGNGSFFRSIPDKTQRDTMIGAAGELFAFEVLSCLDPPLPDFSRSNWQSTIRHYARAHDEYAGLEGWHGSETADIIYDDSGGVLTSMLLDKGYLSYEVWAAKRPTYYIEVKSTTGPCENAFFMSKDQYALVKECSNSEPGSERTDAVYVIFRVFNLRSASPGMRIYIDPEAMRKRGELCFRTEQWRIESA